MQVAAEDERGEEYSSYFSFLGGQRGGLGRGRPMVLLAGGLRKPSDALARVGGERLRRGLLLIPLLLYSLGSFVSLLSSGPFADLAKKPLCAKSS